jgi:YD repeat-containing protein
MLKLDDLRDAVNLYRGSVQFSVPLASLPGPAGGGYSLRLTYDSGAVAETRDNWNLSNPTGLAGLGWSLDLDGIYADYGDPLGSDQSLDAPRLKLRLGGDTYDLIQTGSDAGRTSYVAEPYQFWKITYTQATEVWTVVLEDGSNLTFGDASSGRATVDWGYGWGNWMGASVNAASRVRRAVGWSLSRSADAWGHAYTFTYSQTEAYLGTGQTAAYTQATYLVRVDGALGGHLTLSYDDKLSNEYQNPHGGPGASAWQSRYMTKVLSSVAEVSSGQATLSVTTLNYKDSNGQLETIGSGNFVKRLLAGVSRRAPDGYDLPDLRFTYDVNATSVSYGALLSVTTTAGGEAVFAYTHPGLTLPRRDHALSPPVTANVTYDTPRCFFGRDYAVVLWHGSDNSAVAMAYAWEGRWLETRLAAPSAADATAYGQLRVALGGRCFAVVGAGTYTLFHTDPQMPGGWVGSQTPEAIGLPAGEPVAVAAGDDYIALLATQSGTTLMRWFDGAAWQTMNSSAPDGTRAAAFDGNPDMLIRVSSTGAGTSQDVLLISPGPSQDWTAQSFRTDAWMPGLDGVAVSAGATYAVVTLAGWDGADRSLSYQAMWWGPGGTNISSAPLKAVLQSPSAAPPTVQLRGSSVLIGQDAYRFDGAAWTHQDLSQLVHAGQQQVSTTTLGADAVTRTVTLDGGAVVYDLITYNPAQGGATPWAYVTNMNGVAAKGGTSSVTSAARFGAGRQDAGSRFLLFNNQLFLLGGDGNWASILDIADTFNSTTINSLLLFAETYLVYQTASGVEAYPLLGGGLAAESGITLSNAKLLTGDNVPLAGETAFVAYTGVWGAGAQLTLYRPVAGDVRNALTPLAAQSVVLYGDGAPASTNGSLPYNATGIAYDYDAATATVSRCGCLMAANRARRAEGTTTAAQSPNGLTDTYFFNGLSAAETPSLAYPTGANQTNAASYLAPLAGLMYAQRVFAQGQTSTSYEATAWWWVTALRATPRHLSEYDRCRKLSNSLDGVAAFRSMTYDANTGLVTQLDSTTADGRAIQLTYAYWSEKYDPQRTLNILTPVVQCMQYVDGTLVRGTVITWSDDWGGGGQWAPRAVYVATKSQPAVFNTWTGTPNPVPDGWALSEEVTGRTVAALVRTTRNALNQIGSSLTSGDGLRQIASFANADVLGQEAYYYGFESYEDPGPWRYAGSSLSAHLVADESNLGTRSLEITADALNKTGPTAAWTPSGQNRAYLFACWVQTSPDFATANGAAQFELSVYTVANPPQQVGATIVLPLPATGGTWQYITATVPLGSLRAQNSIPDATRTSIKVLGYNQKSGTQVLVDGLRFQPVDATFFAEVYDPGTFLVLGSLQTNGGTQRVIRDSNHVPTAAVGPEPSVARLSIPSFARLLTSDGSYDETLPNTMLESSAGSAAVYQNFEASDAGQWDLPAGWQMAQGQLTFQGTASPPLGSKATLKNFANPNYVAYVSYLPPAGTTQPNVGVGCGNVVVYHGSQGWVLTYYNGQAWVNALTRSGAAGRVNLVFAILDGRVSFFAGGREVFSYVLPVGVVADGTLNLYLTGTGVAAESGAFKDLIALIDPELLITMSDGRAITGQSIDLRDATEVNARGFIYTPTGLPGYDKNPVYAPVAQTGNLIAGGPTNYLPASAGSPPTLEQYLAYGNGSPFTQTQYEASPLSRPKLLGMPGDEFSVGGGHAAQLAYAQNTATGPMAGLVPDNQAGNYHLTTVTDPDGHLAYALASPQSEVVAQRVKLSDTAALTYGYGYDAAGRLAAVKPPNAYAGAQATDDWDTTYTRDFLGRAVSVVSPDAGATQFAYDSAGRLRFMMDAEGASLSPVRIVYRKYDGLNRVTETGFVQNASVSWATAQSKVDQAAWPGPDLSPRAAQSFVYDADPAAFGVTYGEGRLTQASTYKPDGTLGVRETYSYDQRGNVVTYWLEAPDYDGTVWISAYAYDSLNRLVRADYPKATTDGSPPLRVSYAYDRLGRIVSVGQAPDPNAFVDPLNPPPDLSSLYGRFAYNPDGTVSAVSYNNNDGGAVPIPISLTYTTAGWPLTISSPVYSESLTYTADGYGGGGYYAGQVASVRATWKKSAGALYPLLDYTTRFAYDASGRVTAAAPYIAPPAPASGSLPIQYDPNGNLLTVKRGVSTGSYAYPTAAGGAGQQTRSADTPGTDAPSDRLQSVTGAVSVSCDFEGTASPPSWTWGMTDNGPGGPAVVSGGPGGSTKCLNVPGGVFGAASYLAYRDYLDPRGQYTLTYWIKADNDFAAQQGDAFWEVTFDGPEGPAAAVMQSRLTNVPTAWTQQTLALDMQSLYRGKAAYAQVVGVTIRLVNDKRSGGATAGAAVQIDNLTLSGSGTTGTLTYDAAGRVTSIPNNGLSQLGYSDTSAALASVQTAEDGGYRLDFAHDGAGMITTSKATPTAGTAEKSLFLRSPQGQLQAQFDLGADGSVRRRYVVSGPQGEFVVEEDGSRSYIIKGYDGFARAVADDQCRLQQFYDTDGFGNLQKSLGGAPDTLPKVEHLSGLDVTTALPYVPALGRNLMPGIPGAAFKETRPYPAPPAGGYAEYLFDKVSSLAQNLYKLHFEDSLKYMQHNPSVWFLHSTVIGWSPSDWAFLGMALGGHGFTLQGAGYAAVGLALYYYPVAYGVARFGYIKWAQRSCASRELFAISNEALVEDIYHFQFYGSAESVGGQRLLERSVRPIPDGYYIFVVNENDDFFYREMYDRAGGNELYVRHSMLNGGGCARTAGMMALFGNRITLTNQSGHYGPPVDSLNIAVDLLKKAGYGDFLIEVGEYEKIPLRKQMEQYLKPRN